MLSTYSHRLVCGSTLYHTVCLNTTTKLLACAQWSDKKHASSSASTRWKARQAKDPLTRDAKVKGLKSRAAFKLLEIDAKYKIFKRGQTVVDLGYAPGSWSQVAVERTKPTGRVLGVDILPVQPPKGVSTIQGNFLHSEVRAEVQRFLQDPDWGQLANPRNDPHGDLRQNQHNAANNSGLARIPVSYPLKREYQAHGNVTSDGIVQINEGNTDQGHKEMVDVILSDMSAPWDQTDGFWKKTLSDPYRLMNTTGVRFSDHAGSMDLCAAALTFTSEMLRTGGHFVCKFYQGSEDKDLEERLKAMFTKVHREKPDASRKESREAYFVALRRKGGVS